MEQTSDAGMQISWLGTFCRLLVVLLFIGFFSWGAWKISQPANIWTSNSEIQKTENDVRGIHRDAEKARKEMETPRSFSVESLVYHALNNGYELTDEERLYVQTNWKKFIQNSSIDDDENLLFRLRMRRAEDGSIEDYPLDEWVKKNEERKRAAEEKEKEAQMQQAMIKGAQDVIQKDGKAEESRVKAEDQAKKLLSEKRSNREIIRNAVEEVKENIYSGKPLDGTETEEVQEEPQEDVQEEVQDAQEEDQEEDQGKMLEEDLKENVQTSTRSLEETRVY